MNKENTEKDSRASIKMPHYSKAKVSMLSAYHQKPMWLIVDELASLEIKKLGLKVNSDYG
jgi:hypothetical protein